MKSLIQNDKWKTPDQAECELMAMKTEVVQLKRDKSKQSGTKPNHNGNRKNSQRRIPCKTWKTRPKWLKLHEEPKDLREVRVWQDREFYYCSKKDGGYCAGAWTRYRPKDCNPNSLKKFKGNDQGNKKRVSFDDKAKDADKAKVKKSKIAQAMVSKFQIMRILTSSDIKLGGTCSGWD